MFAVVQTLGKSASIPAPLTGRDGKVLKYPVLIDCIRIDARLIVMKESTVALGS